MSAVQAEAIAGPPVLSRDTSDLPGEMLRGPDVPKDFDPTVDGMLMLHQREWLEDESVLKLAEKGRRAGLTFAEAFDAALIAASAPSAGGSNYFYIGDTKDKGREFLGYVAHFARVVSRELATIEEFLFEDQRDDGTSRYISSFRIVFASGYRVEALSSRPENIRGLQGVVCIDEAAFHKDVRQVIDAVNALLIWGGRIRIISTHNGILNPFNELIREVHAGKSKFSWHFVPFSKAVENGLYHRVCGRSGEAWTQEGQDEWEATIRGSYGSRTAAMNQELDAIPALSEGQALTRVQIEQRMENGIPFERWMQSDEFKNLPSELRKSAALDWCKKTLLPHIKSMNSNRQHFLGEDFARSGDATDMVIMELGTDLTRRQKLIVELRNIPFDQQRDILFFICDNIPNFAFGALEANGNGAYLAEVATQRYGSERIAEVNQSQQWYRTNMPPYIEAFADGSIVLCKHEDVLLDHQSLQYVGGIIRVPKDFRFKGSDGLDRHGDSAVASSLAFFASRQAVSLIAYEGADASDRYPSSAFKDDDEDNMPQGRFEKGTW